MSLLKKPSEIHENNKLSGLIYGQPGVGKTTLALSAPSPVLIDADGGLKRVEKRFQVPSLQMKNYKEFLTLIAGDELAAFETIVFDTLGKLVDMMGDHLAKENPKNRKTDGALSMQGYGALKIEFQRLLRLVREKGKHIIFVAHEREEKDGDVRIVRPDVSGSSGKDLVKDLDFMGYMEMRGNKRTISFTPCEKFYAKNSLRLPDVIEVPSTDKEQNTFIVQQIILKTVEREKQDAEMNEVYTQISAKLAAVVDGVKDVKTANDALAAIVASEHVWDSDRVARASLLAKTKGLGMTYDKQAKTFVNPIKEEADAKVSDNTIAA